MKFVTSNDFSNLTLLVAIIAIVSPVVTTIIDNLFRLNSKRLELESLKHKEHSEFVKRIFENYLSYTGKVINEPNHENLGAYGSAYGLILFYVSDDEAEKIMDCHRCIRRREWDDANLRFEMVSQAIKHRLLNLFNE